MKTKWRLLAFLCAIFAVYTKEETAGNEASERFVERNGKSRNRN